MSTSHCLVICEVISWLNTSEVSSQESFRPQKRDCLIKMDIFGRFLVLTSDLANGCYLTRSYLDFFKLHIVKQTATWASVGLYRDTHWSCWNVDVLFCFTRFTSNTWVLSTALGPPRQGLPAHFLTLTLILPAWSRRWLSLPEAVFRSR